MLVFYVERIASKLLLINTVQQLRAIAFDNEQAEHNDLIQRLWKGFKGDGAIPPIPDERWKELGFQGVDPASDFRSVGILGLQQLVYFAEFEKCKYRPIYQEAEYGPYWYSFAIVALNATNAVCTYLKNGQLDIILYQTSPEGSMKDPAEKMDLLHKIFAELLVSFHRDWMDIKPANLFAFNEVFAKSMRRMEASFNPR